MSPVQRRSRRCETRQPGQLRLMLKRTRASWVEIGGGLLVALVFITIWSALHPSRPHIATSDLFTHLSVARHLIEGDGFVTDITYPLSFAFDFAQELPQPLIHRGPGYALFLTPVVAASPNDPHQVITHVRWLQILVLGLITAIGTSSFIRRKNKWATGAWVVFLGFSPLLNFSVDWAFIELTAGLLLLLIWLRHRDILASRPGPVDGILAGLLAVFRWDLMWLPLLWWLWARQETRIIAARKPSNTIPPLWNRNLLWALIIIVLINLPWAVRNVQLTGDPFFSLQSQAELVKDTRTWPGYSVYQQLQPQPIEEVLSQNPAPVLRKFVRGLKFYFKELGGLFPWAGLIFMALALMVYLRGGIDKNPCPLRPNAEYPMSIVPSDSPLGPLVVSGLTLILLIVQYSFFDHSLRHLIVLFPLVSWELSGLMGLLLQKIHKRWNQNSGFLAIALVLMTVVLVKITMRPLPGWNFAAQQAEHQQSALTEKTKLLVDSIEKVPFVDTSAAPWYANRAAVWDPENDEMRNQIQKKLFK